MATPYRHGSKDRGRGILPGWHDQSDAHAWPSRRIRRSQSPSTTPSSSRRPKAKSGTASTGWETFLEAVIRAGFALIGHLADAN